MEASIADPAVAGEEPVALQSDPPAPVEPEPEQAPEVTPGQITLSTGQTESVADIAVLEAALTGEPQPEWVALARRNGEPFRVRTSAIIRY
jgi:hypothetical protein